MTSDNLSSLPTRGTLLFRLRDWGDTASWTEFYRLYQRMVFDFAKRSGLSHDESQDVTQEVFKRVAETIHEFEVNPNRGSFRRWLLNMTRWRIADKFRARPAGEWQNPSLRSDDDGTSTVERIPEQACSDEVWDTQWREHVLETALGRIGRRISPRHLQAFDLYVRQGLSVLQVSRELGMNPASVYVISHRLTKQLREEVSRLQAKLG